MSVATWPALGTSASLVCHEGDPDAARCAVVAVLEQVDVACSRFREDSELTAVNAAGGRATSVSSLLVELLAVALRAAALTDGIVDPTIGEALVLAGYDRDFALVGGTRPARLRAVKVPGWQVVELDETAGTVRVPAGVRLDLGATAKAHAADRAAERALEASAATGVLVNLGGDIATAGTAPASGWAVRVTDDHRAGAEEPGQNLRIASGGLSTSSTTVRRWLRGEGAAHHIIDPRTGVPAREHWRTASVTAATCTDANIASTAAIVLGTAALAWLQAAGLPARLVASDGTVERVGNWPEEPA